jgi:hypothetical protein
MHGLLSPALTQLVCPSGVEEHNDPEFESYVRSVSGGKGPSPLVYINLVLSIIAELVARVIRLIANRYSISSLFTIAKGMMFISVTIQFIP